jgi:myo-inositol-1(or 4)-monophosphatase
MDRPDDPRLREYLDFACHLADLAGREILPHFRTQVDVHNKAGGAAFDPVTAADRAAEEVIRREIHRVYPDHGIRGEEHGHKSGDSTWTWVIDPIDGTRAFIIGQLHWGTLVALNDGERPVVGVVHQPYVGETFVGSTLGAELRVHGVARPLRARPCPRLEDAILCATHPGVFADAAERAAFDRVARRVRMVRWGGDCYNYALLAAGFVDLVIESSLFAYDVQALVPLIEAAGGAIATWDGGPAHEGGRIVAAGDPALHRVAMHQLTGGG